jgi:hypothetical protein
MSAALSVGQKNPDSPSTLFASDQLRPLRSLFLSFALLLIVFNFPFSSPSGILGSMRESVSFSWLANAFPP